ncbi:DEAD/DEAH box helicase [Desulfogranum mediterraneum]|uniref:DEAD/DEAH box helicase n=1 Tax=Desulfogranum mediterraneum TaxID=160661 RepID=UPI0003FDD4E1|nr:DEAD/DEAH box helicase [Desulfogranum mediterraneum]
MSFKQFQLHPTINKNIAAQGYTTPTPIQEQAITPVLAGQDVLGLAQTGTGKTAAFVLPMLQRLLSGPRRTLRALIVAPTRELAEQIHENVINLAQGTSLRSVVVYGGVGKQPQIKGIRAGAEIVVACPGRLLDILTEKDITLKGIETLVLDEADHMFDKGFLPDIRRIVRQLPKDRQSLVFSATMPREIRRLADEILIDPCVLQVNHTAPAPTISHALIRIAKAEKTQLLRKLLAEREMKSTVVFTRTKHKARSLARQLEKSGFPAVSLQGNLSQQQRRRAMDGFRDGTFRVLVATDIAARGIDVSGVSHVINYDVPDTAETYTHRTGRTGRAHNHGQAITFADNDDRQIITRIERNLGKKMELEQAGELPAPAARIAPAPRGQGNSRNSNNPARSAAKPAQGRSKSSQASRRPSRGKGRASRAASFDFGVGASAK